MVMYGCESWTVKKAEHWRTDAFELWYWRRLLRVQPVHSEGDQPWDFFGGNDAKAEMPILWPPHAKSWLIGKDPDAGRDWGQEEKRTTEDEMAGWYHQVDGCEFEWTLGDGYGQGGLECCDSWDRKELDMTERLNCTEWNNFHWKRVLGLSVSFSCLANQCVFTMFCWCSTALHKPRISFQLFSFSSSLKCKYN